MPAERHSSPTDAPDGTDAAELIGETESAARDARGELVGDPPPGLLPAATHRLLDGRLTVRSHGDLTVVSLEGVLDDELAHGTSAALDDTLLDGGPVVLDLDHVALVDRDSFEDVARAVRRGGPAVETCLVASRLSARMMFDRWAVTERFAIFSTLADARQARSFAADGYGRGWAPR